MTDEEIRIKESELKYAIGNLVDNLICYKGECNNQADSIAELEKKNAELKAQAKEIIKNLLVYVPVDLKEYEEAKQFISEVEK